MKDELVFVLSFVSTFASLFRCCYCYIETFVIWSLAYKKKRRRHEETEKCQAMSSSLCRGPLLGVKFEPLYRAWMDFFLFFRHSKSLKTFPKSESTSFAGSVSPPKWLEICLCSVLARRSSPGWSNHAAISRSWWTLSSRSATRFNSNCWRSASASGLSSD